jgi:hypothetical protein
MTDTAGRSASERELAIAALHSVGLSWFDAEQIITAIEAEAARAALTALGAEVEAMWLCTIDTTWTEPAIVRSEVLNAINRAIETPREVIDGA